MLDSRKTFATKVRYWVCINVPKFLKSFTAQIQRDALFFRAILDIRTPPFSLNSKNTSYQGQFKPTITRKTQKI